MRHGANAVLAATGTVAALGPARRPPPGSVAWVLGRTRGATWRRRTASPMAQGGPVRRQRGEGWRWEGGGRGHNLQRARVRSALACRAGRCGPPMRGRRRNGSVPPSACDPDAAATTAAARGTLLSVPRLFPSSLPLHADGLGAYGAQPEAAPQPRSGCGKKADPAAGGALQGGRVAGTGQDGVGDRRRALSGRGDRTPALGRPRRAAPGGAGRLCAPSPAGATPPRLSMVK